MRAVLVKNKGWSIVSGKKPKPVPADPGTPSDAEKTAIENWEEEDGKAQADLHLSISDAELKQVKTCTKFRELWTKLETVYESKAPAREAILWWKLLALKLQDNGDVKSHVDEFFDIINKLDGLSVQIGEKLQSLMLLQSLPSSYDNFRCAIETQDELPSSEVLKGKICDETMSRKRNDGDTSAMFVKKQGKRSNHYHPRGTGSETPKTVFTGRCHGCQEPDHKVADCSDRKKRHEASTAQDVSMYSDILRPLRIRRR